jgi:hypothetical protein
MVPFGLLFLVAALVCALLAAFAPPEARRPAWFPLAFAFFVASLLVRAGAVLL